METRAAIVTSVMVLAAAFAPGAAAAAGWEIGQVFTNGALASMDDAELASRKIKAVHLGMLELPSGRIVAVDPLTLYQPEAYQRTVPPGRYPVTLYGALGRIAAASIRFAEGTPDHWEMATLADQDPRVLKAEEIFAYPVDAGLGSFMDMDTVALVWERNRQAEAAAGKQYAGYYDAVLAGEMTAHGDDYVLHRPIAGREGNVAIFSSGWGDGLYPSFWGLDKQGRPLVLLTEFYVIRNADGLEEQK